MKEFKIGSIVNTHGLKGEVKVKVTTDFPHVRFAKKAEVFVKLQNEMKKLTVKSVRENKGMLLVLFDGYDDINKIELYKGCSLYIYEDQLQELEDDEAYFHEMMDSTVYNMDGKLLGQVVEIIETGANVVLRVKQGEQQMLIPFVKAFVKEFDKQEKIMRVECMEGL